MPYFNGGIHGWNGPNGYVRPEPCTRILCAPCAEIELPLKPVGTIGRHWHTDFKWAPHYGANCRRCGKAT
jgi:hypothetical protein